MKMLGMFIVHVHMLSNLTVPSIPVSREFNNNKNNIPVRKTPNKIKVTAVIIMSQSTYKDIKNSGRCVMYFATGY